MGRAATEATDVGSYGGLAEGRHWLEELLAAAPETTSLPRVKALIGLAWVCYWLADLGRARPRADLL